MATAPQVSRLAPRASALLVAIPAMNALVLAATLFTLGLALPGKAAAARYTAIFSAFVFGFVLIARSNGPLTATLSSVRVPLTQAFALGHFVHYAAVLWMWFTPGGNPLASDGLIMLPIAAFGSLHIFLLGWLAARQETGGAGLKRFHAAMVYAALIFFALALSTKVPASLVSTAVLTWLMVALGVRITAAVKH
jgi:hypothetical protein